MASLIQECNVSDCRKMAVEYFKLADHGVGQDYSLNSWLCEDHMPRTMDDLILLVPRLSRRRGILNYSFPNISPQFMPGDFRG